MPQIDINGLRQKRAAKIERMGEILQKAVDEGRDMTAAEQAAHAELETEVKTIERHIEQAEEIERLKASTAKPIKPETTTPQRVPARARATYRLKSFKGANAEEDAYRSGMFIAAAVYGSDVAKAWCRDHGVPLVRAAGEGINTAGGFIVPDEFGTTIIDLRDEYGVFAQWARAMPMSSDHKTHPRVEGGLTAYPIGEGVSITESEKTWGNVGLTAKKWGVLTRYSSELEEDAIIDMADDLAMEIARAFAEAEDGAGFTGDGTSNYHGIVGLVNKIVDGNHAGSLVTAGTNIDTLGEITTGDLATVMAKCPKYAKRNARWYCSEVAFDAVFSRLVSAAGGNTVDTLSGAVNRRYLGYPVETSVSLPDGLTTDYTGLAMLFFGDLRLAAMMGRRREMTIAMSDQRYFEQDQIGIRGTERFDINIHDLGNATVAGPVVALIGA